MPDADPNAPPSVLPSGTMSLALHIYTIMRAGPWHCLGLSQHYALGRTPNPRSAPSMPATSSNSPSCGKNNEHLRLHIYVFEYGIILSSIVLSRDRLGAQGCIGITFRSTRYSPLLFSFFLSLFFKNLLSMARRKKRRQDSLCLRPKQDVTLATQTDSFILHEKLSAELVSLRQGIAFPTLNFAPDSLLTQA